MDDDKFLERFNKRLKSKIVKSPRVSGMSACWIWQGSKDRDGRATAWYRTKNVQVRRLLMDAQSGELVISTCGVSDCVNPAHLKIGGQADRKHVGGRGNLRSERNG